MSKYMQLKLQTMFLRGMIDRKERIRVGLTQSDYDAIVETRDSLRMLVAKEPDLSCEHFLMEGITVCRWPYQYGPVMPGQVGDFLPMMRLASHGDDPFSEVVGIASRLVGVGCDAPVY